MKPITFVEPDALPGVFDALAGESSRIIAGGSDLLGELKVGSAAYGRLVSLGRIDALRGIENGPEGLRIGALVTIARLEAASEMSGPYRIMADAARSIATPEIRGQGTVGGNLCQRPRCLHYRHALVNCLKKGGEGCPAVQTPYQSYLSIFGGAVCYAVNASDLAPPLIAMDATAVVEGSHGRRELPLESFFAGPQVDPTRENVLAAGEVLTAVRLPAMPSGWSGEYHKARERTAGDFAVVSLALGCELRDGRSSHVRLVLGGVAPTPLRVRAAEAALEGEEPSEAVAAMAAAAALSSAAPLEHNAYKLDLVRALILRGVMRWRDALSSPQRA